MTSTTLIDLDTATSPAADYMRRVDEYIFDYQAIQRTAIEHVEGICDGSVTVTDPTNPFVTFLGISALNTSTAVLTNTADLRLRYSVLATTPEHLYNHMSDKDYDGRFATPSVKKVLCLIAINELKARMVLQSDGSTKAVIPRFSNLIVDDIAYTLLYPVEIREPLHGNWSVRYDLSVAHPLQTLTSSGVYWTTREYNKNKDTKFLQIELELVQVSVGIAQYDLNPSTGLDKDLTLSGDYCSAQAWYKSQSSNSWIEIKTTHSDMVYDANTPTAVLKVLDASFNIRIPMIYFTNGVISGRLKLIVYTTKGVVFINADGKELSNFQSNWAGDASDTVSPEVAAWQAIQSKFFFFTGIAQGGSAALTFEQLKERVNSGAVGPQLIPITPAQREFALEKDGYTMRQFVDVTTSRQILASKGLPNSKDPTLITPGTATIASVIATLDALKASPWVSNNQDRVTITPDALWELQSGVVRLVTGQELLDLMALEGETRATAINAASYLYSPYYYVLDTATDVFTTRAYHMSNPQVVVDKYIGENETTGMQIEIDAVSLLNTGTGWQLRVSTLSNKVWKDQDISYRIAQLTFEPPGIGTSAAVNASLVVSDTDEDIFIFDLPSSYDVDANNMLSHIGFHAITAEPREVFSALEQVFSVIFCTTAPLDSSVTTHSLDNAIVRVGLPVRCAAVAAQQVKCTFGIHLEHLWTACRTIASSSSWQTYPVNVPAVYAKDVYEINPSTGTEVWFDPDSKPYFKKTASAGDVIVQNGETVYEHLAGEIIYAGNTPVPISSGLLQRQFDMLFLEGSYYFATDASTTTYSSEMVEVLTSYITVDVPKFADRVLEKTSVYFYPKVTLGTVYALVDAGVVINIQADQKLTVRLGVTKSVFENTVLRTQLEVKTVQTINEFFTRASLSISELTNELRRVYAGDVLSILPTGLGGNNSANAITLVNANERCSLKKRVTVLDNGEFTVREAVTIDFFKHAS